MVKMFHTCVDNTLQHLSVVEKNTRLFYDDLQVYLNMKIYQGELRLYRMLLWCIPDTAVDVDLLANLNSLAASIVELYKLDPVTDSFALTDADEYNLLLPKVDEKRHKCNNEISKKRYFEDLMSSFSCEAEAEAEPSCFTPINNKETIVEYLDSVHAVLDYDLEDIDKSLVETVLLLRELIYNTSPPQTNSNFQSMVNDWASKAASFSLLHWLFVLEDETNRRLQNDLQQIVNPCNPGFINLCFQVIKVPMMKHEDRLLFGEFVSRFIDFFLDNLLFVLNDDDFPIVREGLIFIITFLADPPANILDHSQFIMPFVQEQIYAVLDQASDTLCFFRESNIDLSRGKKILDPFLKSIDEVRGDIVNLYFHIPPFSWSTFPRINKLGYLDCLLAYLENLEDIFTRSCCL